MLNPETQPDPGLGPPEPDTLTALFQQYANPLCRYVYRYVGSMETAQDLVQDVFLRLCVGNAGRGELTEGYLYVAARNRALTHLKHRRIELRSRDQAVGLALVEPAAGPDALDRLASAELTARVQQAVDALPERQRQTVLLRWRGDSYEAIAGELGISLKTVSNHLTRAMQGLREALPVETLATGGTTT